jgi:hypothetical protein
MADNSQQAPGATELKPGFCFDQARDLRALPQAVAGIDGLCGLKYLNTNEVPLMRPQSGFVVDEFNSYPQCPSCLKRQSKGPSANPLTNHCAPRSTVYGPALTRRCSSMAVKVWP